MLYNVHATLHGILCTKLGSWGRSELIQLRGREKSHEQKQDWLYYYYFIIKVSHNNKRTMQYTSKQKQ